MKTLQRFCKWTSLQISLEALLIALLWSQGAPAQEAPSESISLDVYREPKVKPLAQDSYPVFPISERRSGKDGWVYVNLMVSPEGKPYEIMVAESSGNKALEKSALEAVRKWSFQPGTLEGKPIDSATMIKLRFRLTGAQGASSRFVKSFKAAVQAIQKKDKPAAEVVISSLSPQNLYETSYAGLAEYYYAVQWGTQSQQLAGLSRAIAQENHADYLPEDSYKTALRAIFPLQVNERHYRDALKTWDRLRMAENDDPQALAPFKSVVDQISTLKTDGSSFTVSGRINETSWSHSLLKTRFHVSVTSGHVAQLKLRCQQNYVSFAFDPEVDYRVADKAGDCTLEVIGDPDTAFDLVQS